jgi:hypothetical protein
MVRYLLHLLGKHFLLKFFFLCGREGVSVAAKFIKYDTKGPDIRFLRARFISPKFWCQVKWRANSIVLAGCLIH